MKATSDKELLLPDGRLATDEAALLLEGGRRMLLAVDVAARQQGCGLAVRPRHQADGAFEQCAVAGSGLPGSRVLESLGEAAPVARFHADEPQHVLDICSLQLSKLGWNVKAVLEHIGVVLLEVLRAKPLQQPRRPGGAGAGLGGAWLRCGRGAGRPWSPAACDPSTRVAANGAVSEDRRRAAGVAFQGARLVAQRAYDAGPSLAFRKMVGRLLRAGDAPAT